MNGGPVNFTCGDCSQAKEQVQNLQQQMKELYVSSKLNYKIFSLFIYLNNKLIFIIKFINYI